MLLRYIVLMTRAENKTSMGREEVAGANRAAKRVLVGKKAKVFWSHLVCALFRVGGSLTSAVIPKLVVTFVAGS